MLNPFFFNSNICLDEQNIKSSDKFFESIAGNIGNSYITYSLIKELCGGLKRINHIKNIYTYDFSKSDKDVDIINNESSHFIFVLQDQIRVSESYGLQLRYKEIENFITKINKPVIIAGLGANSFNGYDNNFHKKLNPDLIYFLQFLSDKCNEIGIRGYFTQEVLHKLGINNVRVIGCPSFFETGKDRVVVKKEDISLDSILLTSFFDNNLLAKNHQIMQDYNEEKFIKAIAYNDVNSKFSDLEIEKLINHKYHIFSNLNDWKKFVSNFNFAIGMRLHGSILALNSGVPAICCNNDSRAREMCEFLKIPYNPHISKKSDIWEIYKKLDLSELNNSYSKLYDNFENFLRNNNLKIYSENFQDDIKQPSLELYRNDINKEYSSILKKRHNKWWRL